MKPLDLMVIGGGVHGAAIARDAAARGMSVLLVEQADFGSGTSSRSSKLAHGGLRYLEHLELGLVREALRERDLLLEMAPHLAWPLPFLIPLGGPAPRAGWKVRIGLSLYDLLAGPSPLGDHRIVDAGEAVRLAPGLAGSGLEGAAEYFDAGMDDARIVVELVVDAASLGAKVEPRCRALSLLREKDRVIGARLQREQGEVEDVLACLTILACGPWTNLVAGPRRNASSRLVLTKGAHVFVEKALVRDAALFLAAMDGRIFFVIPWRARPGDAACGSLIGTTDTPFAGDPALAVPDAEDVRYLLGAVNSALPAARLSTEDVVAAQAGVRPLVAGDTPGSVSALSRDWQLDEAEEGLLVIEGGKYTIFRQLAETVVDRAVEIVQEGEPVRRFRACVTRERHLPGAGPGFLARRESRVAGLLAAGVLPHSAQHLVSRYGLRAAEVVACADGNLELLRPACKEHPHVPAEAVHAVRHEFARSAADVLLRRLGLGWWRCAGLRCADSWRSVLKSAGIPADAAAWLAYETEVAEQWRVRAENVR